MKRRESICPPELLTTEMPANSPKNREEQGQCEIKVLIGISAAQTTDAQQGQQCSYHAAGNAKDLMRVNACVGRQIVNDEAALDIRLPTVIVPPLGCGNPGDHRRDDRDKCRNGQDRPEECDLMFVYK